MIDSYNFDLFPDLLLVRTTPCQIACLGWLLPLQFFTSRAILYNGPIELKVEDDVCARRVSWRMFTHLLSLLASEVSDDSYYLQRSVLLVYLISRKMLIGPQDDNQKRIKLVNRSFQNLCPTIGKFFKKIRSQTLLNNHRLRDIL